VGSHDQISATLKSNIFVCATFLDSIF